MPPQNPYKPHSRHFNPILSDHLVEKYKCKPCDPIDLNACNIKSLNNLHRQLWLVDNIKLINKLKTKTLNTTKYAYLNCSLMVGVLQRSNVFIRMRRMKNIDFHSWMIGPDDSANNLSNHSTPYIQLREKNKGARTKNVLGRWKPDEASIKHRLDAIVPVQYGSSGSQWC